MLVRLVQSLNALLSCNAVWNGYACKTCAIFKYSAAYASVIPLQIFTHFISSVYEDQGL